MKDGCLSVRYKHTVFNGLTELLLFYLQEIVIENFEQLFDNEEWLDDDFGFSSAIKSEFQRPPYCDRIIDQQDYCKCFLFFHMINDNLFGH